MTEKSGKGNEKGVTFSPEKEVDMAALYEETFKNLEEGSVVEGTILSVQADGVFVDIGYKSEGFISREEFSPQEFSTLKVGNALPVYLEEREDAEGNTILSKEKADRMKIWEKLEALHEQGEVIEGKILSRIKGGMVVDIGIKAFLPGSQIDLHSIRDMDQLIGKTYPMKIIKMNNRRRNIIVSRRVLLEESREKRRQTLLSSLVEGKLLTGVVKNITDYGAFVDLGGIDGLLHITDMSWGRVNRPSELFSVGDKVEVIILKYDKETGRVSLGYKQRTADPWTGVEKKYPVGSRVKGKVVNLTDYGAFVEIEPGVEGLVHISEMSWSREVKHPSKHVSIGDAVNTVILNIDKDNRKLSLGMRQAEQSPWELIEQKYPVGTKIEGKVKTITDFGVFVGLEEGVDGLIHISDMSWTKRISHPSEVFKKGQQVEAVILRVDREKERVSLGYRQLTPDPWETDIPARYEVGKHVKGRVLKTTDFGVFLELEDGVEGLLHATELGEEPQMKVGDDITVKVIKLDPVERKIALSLKEYKKDLERSETEHYLGSQQKDETFGSLGQRAEKKQGKKDTP